MLPLSIRTRNFWCAAFYHRRASPERDRLIVEKVLQQVTAVTSGTVRMRAVELLIEIGNAGNEQPPRAG